MLRIVTVCALTALAAPAAANEAVNRFEAASETLSAKINTVLVLENPAMAGKTPDVIWDEAHRTAGACILATVAGEAGAPAMTQLIVGLERAAGQTYSSLAEIGAASAVQVEGIKSSRLQEITDACGMTTLTMQRMVDAAG
ncbi:MAG: hypothetical protein ACI9KS_000018 [Sulfitobacter sp.]|jgi:hypothetical protein